ncbi:hypothetical protein DY000_02019081 [Brassica cretica]|uniref:Uncharacterized protein n=1 Tax=Brassica cretica TaxID=69181 RepID=A0ABQ7D6V6_BRACR|nr:hypothetical protein DY000_02019081 [Brassica cretica]
MANNSQIFTRFLLSQNTVDLDSPEPFWYGSQGPDESSSEVPVTSPVLSEEEQFVDPEVRPPGVKAAKAGKKTKSGREEELSQLQGVLEIKQKLSKQKLLDRLLAKTEPLSEMETSLKLKLMSEML